MSTTTAWLKQFNDQALLQMNHKATPFITTKKEAKQPMQAVKVHRQKKM